MKRIWLALFLFTAVLLSASGGTAVPALARPARQDTPPTAVPDPAAQAQTLWENMSVAERVGQLFLVTFPGDRVLPDSAITDLILNYHIGGVVLQQPNDNISGYGNPANAPLQVAELTATLQELALTGTAVLTNTAVLTETAVTPFPLPAADRTAIPLLIALNQEGDNAPYSHIFNGLTELPSSMAIGATWQPDSARLVGDVLGQELAAIGVNMLLGPVLDVLENPSADSASNLGVRSFGGDPYWVGLMGQAYIDGVHVGSNGRVAVIAKHFPGFGASDRPLNEEIPTVQKELSQLELVELAPFFAVTGGAGSASETADGLLSTHIRYQGFQGNIRATTNPVSLDAQALAALMQLPSLSGWRQNGGVIVSDSLGTRAIERFYDNTGQDFPHRVVAKDAFLAGNDLLYLGEFALGNAPYAAQLANMQDTMLWFQERYREDAAFQSQVDTAVLRILEMKLRLYDQDFSTENVLVDPTAEAVTAVTNNSQPRIFEVAQDAVTLISPSPNVLAERLARPPGRGENIVIFTDVRETAQCTTCPPQPLISRTALQERILALYGPNASGQVLPEQVVSYTFAELNEYLAAGPDPIIYNAVPITPTVSPDAQSLPETVTPEPIFTATPPPAYLVQESLQVADWIIFAMLDDGPQSQAVSEFLAQRPDLARGRQVIAFAFNAPYYLDTTEITQLTAYYGVYSKVAPFLDAAVRALFQELPLQGAPPISLNAIGYDLFSQTQPDPNQVIPLAYIASGETTEAASDAEPLPVSVGDTLRLQTGVIVDRQGNPVPDGTVVRFIERDRIAGSLTIIAEVATNKGVVQWDYVLQTRTEGGKFRIGVEAGEAVVSQELDISVGETAAEVQIIVPTAVPTNTPSPTSTPSPTATSTPPPTLTPPPTPLPVVPDAGEPGLIIELSEFMTLTAVTLGLLIIIGTATLIGQRIWTEPEQQLGWLLWGMVGGLLCYLYVVLGLPGTAVFANMGAWAGLVTTLIGGGLGMAAYRLRHRPINN